MLSTLLKKIAAYSLADLLTKLFKFGTFPLFAHLLAVEDFGILSLANAMMELAFLFANCGLCEAANRFYRSDERQSLIASGAAALVIFSLAVTLLAFACRPVFPAMLPPQTLLCGLCSIVPVQLYLYGRTLLRLTSRLALSSTLSMAQTLLGLGLCLLFTGAFQWGVTGYLAGLVVSYVLVLPVVLWNVKADLKGAIRLQNGLRMLGFGYPCCIAAMAYWIFGSVDRWILAELSGAIDVSLYSIAFKLCSLLILLNIAVSEAWKPHALQLEGHHAPLIFSSYLSLSFYLFTVMGCALSLFGQELLMLLTPPPYWDAAELIPPIAIGLAVFSTSQVSSVSIMISDRTHYISAAAWLSAAANVIMNIILVPQLGALGAAWATCASYCLLAALYLYAAQKFYPIPLDKSILSYCLLSCSATLIFSIWANTFIWSYDILAVKAAFFGIVFIPAVFRLKRATLITS